jgi:hypothetical protein
MLRETDVAQKEEGVFRRWFEDKYFELIVWYDKEGGQITGFQLCYDRYKDEHSLTWFKDKGFQHNRIESDRNQHKHPSTPILVEDGIFPAEDILMRFIDSCHKIDLNISLLIISKLLELVEESSTKKNLKKVHTNVIIKLLSEINKLKAKKGKSGNDIRGASKPIEHDVSFTEKEIEKTGDTIHKKNNLTDDIKGNGDIENDIKIKYRSRVDSEIYKDQQAAPQLLNKIKSVFNGFFNKMKSEYSNKTDSDYYTERKDKIESLMKNAECLSKKMKGKKLK